MAFGQQVRGLTGYRQSHPWQEMWGDPTNSLWCHQEPQAFGTGWSQARQDPQSQGAQSGLCVLALKHTVHAVLPALSPVQRRGACPGALE